MSGLGQSRPGSWSWASQEKRRELRETGEWVWGGLGLGASWGCGGLGAWHPQQLHKLRPCQGLPESPHVQSPESGGFGGPPLALQESCEWGGEPHRWEPPPHPTLTPGFQIGSIRTFFKYFISKLILMQKQRGEFDTPPQPPPGLNTESAANSVHPRRHFPLPVLLDHLTHFIFKDP